MKKSKRPSFRVALAVLAGLYAVLIVVGLLVFYGVLRRYEQNHPAGAMDAYFAALRDGDADKILADSDFPFDAVNTRDSYWQYLRGRYRDGVGQWQYAQREQTDAKQIYEVYENNKKYGELTLQTQPEGGYRVFSDWSYQSEMRLVSPAPVCANGAPLTAAGDSPPAEIPEFKGLSGSIPKLSVYRVQALTQPEITLADGQESTLTPLADGSVQVTAVPSAADSEQLTAFAQQVARTYASYISKDAEWSALQAMLESGTPFMREVRAYDNYWYNQHRAVAFENMQVKTPVQWSADLFTVDVSFDFVVSRTYDSHTYPTAYHIACRRTGDRFYVVNITPL